MRHGRRGVSSVTVADGTRFPTFNIYLALPLTQSFKPTMANMDQSKDDHGEEKPTVDPDRPPILSFGDSNQTRSPGWDPTLLVRSEKSGRISVTSGLLATSKIWKIGSRSDPGARRRWFVLVLDPTSGLGGSA
ncbi:hypothetical protein U1Q18_007076 [Sarracenia purpurea var. burkii]